MARGPTAAVPVYALAHYQGTTRWRGVSERSVAHEMSLAGWPSLAGRFRLDLRGLPPLETAVILLDDVLALTAV